MKIAGVFDLVLKRTDRCHVISQVKKELEVVGIQLSRSQLVRDLVNAGLLTRQKNKKAGKWTKNSRSLTPSGN